ncbi:PP2C family protein-serine/threonine phosphatase [Pseudonocardia xinjiangensis]|uniref:Serine/threonine-protein phosphatase n=1 Tax=Pseudonocardia xinjiangensis TaxID=75289 RepID=A0ABX1RPU3_9PSEU|nr:PP2C family protein-serine/threonine phosphatase [Pseudonocardia xinjiangensis]NMH82398.1 serine/threonine-protein phosphatase [Pseudonocardia xinjiangensis]
MELLDARWHQAMLDVLAGAHLASGDALGDLLEDALEPLEVVPELYVADHEQIQLRPVRDAGGPLWVDGTLPGRVFQLGTVLEGRDDEGRRVLWVPLVDGAERLGVARMVLTANPNDEDSSGTDPTLAEHCLAVAGLVAHLMASKFTQGDELAVARRSRPMSVAGELLWQLLPPLTVGGKGLAMAAVLEPAYNVSGDAFDYAISTSRADFAIFDSSGHDLNAGLTTSVTLAASRSARREGHDIAGVAARIDATLTEQFSDHRFVTGVLAQLDLQSGCLRYLIAGHPPPVLLRGGKVVRTLDAVLRMPFGRLASLMPQSDELGEEYLEPGDRILLHSDGVVEARDEDGEEFGVDRLVELAEHAAAAQLAAPETLRRLAHAVREHRRGELRDDATLMLVEWSGSAAERLLTRPMEDGQDH